MANEDIRKALEAARRKVSDQSLRILELEAQLESLKPGEKSNVKSNVLREEHSGIVGDGIGSDHDFQEMS